MGCGGDRRRCDQPGQATGPRERGCVRFALGFSFIAFDYSGADPILGKVPSSPPSAS
jgi:hypothetical protein